MKKIFPSVALLLFVAPFSLALADLPIPTGVESVPAGAKYAPPCERGDIMIDDVCIERRFANVFRAESAMRREERFLTRVETHFTQRQDTRNIYLHPTGVRASD